MEIAARLASPGDIPELVRLYRLLEAELVALKPIWNLTEGLAEPPDTAFGAALEDPATTVLAGTIDGVPVGFLLGRSDPLLPQAGEERVASVRLVFTEEAARGVGVGEAMLERFMTDHRATGHRLFDAHVSPGHRIAKNFYEAHGFKARHIVMHHRADEDG